MPITVTGSSQDGAGLFAFASTDGYSDIALIDVAGVYAVVEDVQPSLPLPPPEPSPDNEPPLPPIYQPEGYTPGRFNHKSLPALPTQPSTSLVTTVPRTLIYIDERDYSGNFISGDIYRPLHGISKGVLKLQEAVDNATALGYAENNRFDDSVGNNAGVSTLNNFSILDTAERPLIRPGDRVRWLQRYANADVDIFLGYVLNTPTPEVSSDGSISLTVEIGDQLALKELDERIDTDPYCGEPPTTAGDAARIYAQKRGLSLTGFPPGTNLVEPPQDFIDESPFDFLEKIYAPSNRDVGTDWSGRVRLFVRPEFDPDKAFKFTFADTLQVSIPNRSIKPYSEVQVYNRYTRDYGYPFWSETSVTNLDQWSFNDLSEVLAYVGTVELTTPFVFSETKPITVETTTYLGSTIFCTTYETYGWIPASFFPDFPSSPNSLVNDIPVSRSFPRNGIQCEDPFNAFYCRFGQITKTTKVKSLFKHDSGAYLIRGETETVTGIVESRYSYTELNDGSVPCSDVPAGEYYEEEMIRLIPRTYIKKIDFDLTVEPIVEEGVCRRNWQWRVRQSFAIDRNFSGGNFANENQTEITYTPLREEAATGGSAISKSQVWRKVTNGSDSVSPFESFLYSQRIIKPKSVQVEYVDSPPPVNWIRSRTADITVYGRHKTQRFVNRYGNKPSKLMDAPLCFNVEQADRYAKRWLDTNNGLHEAVAIVIPYYRRLSNGSSIQYTDQYGNVTKGIVWSIEVNQTRNTATQLITILKTVF